VTLPISVLHRPEIEWNLCGVCDFGARAESKCHFLTKVGAERFLKYGRPKCSLGMRENKF